MKTMKLQDCELSVADYSNFELNLLLNGGRIIATVNPSTTNGTKRVRLINPVIMFDEKNAAEERIESLAKYFQFQHKPQH